MAVSINQITQGMALQINEEIFLVQAHQHVKPGKGPAFAKVKLKNVRTGQTLDKTLRSSDKFDDVDLKERKLQALYQSGNSYHFMDCVSYDQIELPVEIIGDDIKFLQENAEVIGVFNNDQVLDIKLPTFILTAIDHTEVGLKGDSSKAGTKSATIDTGAIIQVPLFIETGERIKVDTRTGTYVERAKE